MSDFKLLFKKKSTLSKADRKKKRKVSKLVGLFLILIQVIMCAVFLINLTILNMVPNTYIVYIILVFLVVLGINYGLQFTKVNIIGKVLSVFLSISLLVGSIYIAKAISTINEITNPNLDNSSKVSIVVLSSDSAQSWADIKDSKFGINSAIEKEITTQAISKINDKLESSINTTEYKDWQSLINALYNKDIRAIVLNEAYRSAIEDLFPDFSTKTKTIGETISIANQTTEDDTTQLVDDDSITLYLAGNDQYGQIETIGRNDVNIIATINPKTKQILLLTTPRDYYISLTSKSGKKGLDKLTHAGNYGIQGSVTALQNLYKRKIDYYVKLNFTGMIGIVDALGGVTIHSDYDFVSYHGGYSYTVGSNYCDGDKALSFCRERYAFPNGDFQRGRDQMYTIKAIFAKASSPAILTNYTQVMNSMSGFFETSMPTSTIQGLVKETLNGGGWNIQSYDVSGTTSTQDCQLFGFSASVVLPDYNTVNVAKDLMNKIGAGEVFDVNSYVNSKLGK